MVTTKQISSFIVSASLSQDATAIIFTFTDGTKQEVKNLSPIRFSAVLATLQATPIAYYLFDPLARSHYVSSSQDIPGPVKQAF